VFLYDSFLFLQSDNPLLFFGYPIAEKKRQPEDFDFAVRNLKFVMQPYPSGAEDAGKIQGAGCA
jgi:hypothetical protein